MNLSYPSSAHTQNEKPRATPSLTARISTAIRNSLKLYRFWWKDIGFGLFIRLLSLGLILVVASINPFFPDVNDMLELHTRGLEYLFQGLNPYSRDYWLSALGTAPRDWYFQPFLNYGPLSLLIHLPCMIYPYSFDFAGFMDFQPSFTILHAFFDFLIFDRMMRKKYRGVALFVWANPMMITLNFVTQMSVVLFLLWMGYEQWKDPFWSVFWLGLGTITYQYIGLLLLFAIAYHFRSYRKWVLGLIPAVTIFGVFQIWASLEAVWYADPTRHMALFNDLLFFQFGRPYQPWPQQIHAWWSWTGSLAAILFNVYWISHNLWMSSLGQPMIPYTDWVAIGDPLQQVTQGLLPPVGIRISTVITGFALIVTAYLLIRLLLKSEYDRSIRYSVIAIVLFLLGAPAGIWHHNFITVIPLFFLLTQTPIMENRLKRWGLRDS
ncbi:MAG: hypothetical protein ACFE89_10285 [Candidatus Hodarchaeota archaeon]